MAEQTETAVDLTVVKEKVLDGLTWASAIVLKEESDWIKARELRRDIALREKVVDKHFKKIKAPGLLAQRSLLAIEHEYTDPIEETKEILDKKILQFEETYFDERTLLALQIQANERDRAETERLQHAEELEQDGDHDAAQALMAQPLRVPSIVIPEYNGWLPGESRTETWGCDEESIDLMKLAKAVVDGTISTMYILPNMKALNATADTLKTTFNIPGCKAKRRRGIKQR